MQTYCAPLQALAGAFGRFAGGGLGEAGARVAAAMRAHPALVAFPGALDTELMAGAPVVAKIGAEAVVAVGLADGRGLALKVARRQRARPRPGHGLGGARGARAARVERGARHARRAAAAQLPRRRRRARVRGPLMASVRP